MADSANANTGSSAKGHFIIIRKRLALEGRFSQWMESEKGLLVRTPRTLTAVTTCVESRGVSVSKDCWRRGAQPVDVYKTDFNLVVHSESSAWESI